MKMIASEKLALLLAYLSTRRGVGHTRALMVGAQNAGPVAVLTHTYKYGQDLKRKAGNITIAAWDDHWAGGDPLYGLSVLRGTDLPLVIDHHAFAVIGREMVVENQGLLSELRIANTDYWRLLRFNKTTLAIHDTAMKKARAVETAYQTRIAQLERKLARKAAEVLRLRQATKRRKLGNGRKGKKKL